MLHRWLLVPLAIIATSCASESGSEATTVPPGSADSAAVTAPPVGETVVELEGQWEVTELFTADGPQELLDDYPIMMKVSDNVIGGDAPCNGFQALVESRDDDGAIDVGVVASTRKLCADEAANALEQAFLEALEMIDRYELGDELTLMGPVGIFIRADPKS